MMYPRLLLARDLLSKDGVILVSIGDDEVKNLHIILDEVFGEKNFVCTFVWKSRAKPTNAGSSQFKPQKVAEYILCYSKSSPDNLILNAASSKQRSYPHEDEQGRFRTTTILTSNRGTFKRETMRFESHGYIPNEDYRWKAGKDTIDRLYDTNHIFINEDGVPLEKKYEHEEDNAINPIYTFIDPVVSGTAENGKQDLTKLLGNKHGFDTVKPLLLMQFLVKTFSNKYDTVLDFFSGSATTSHAIIKLNAEDGGHRKFIMVQVPEKCDESSEAYKAGYKNICEIGKERIRRAGKLILDELNKKNEGSLFEDKTEPDVGFRVFKQSDAMLADLSVKPEEADQLIFKQMSSKIKNDRAPEDLLFYSMLELGVPLSEKIEQISINNHSIYKVENANLIACFDQEIDEEMVTEVAKMNPDYFILREDSIDDSLINNIDSIFKVYSKNADVEDRIRIL